MDTRPPSCRATMLLWLWATTLATPALAAPTGAIVVPDHPSLTVDFAARELQAYTERATGARLPIVAEQRAPLVGRRIYVGPTRAAAAAGVDASRLTSNAYRIRAKGQVAYLLGRDGLGQPISDGLSTPVGTLFAVYDVLDNDLGVRWLWPGRSGEVVPRRADLRIRPRDVTVLPRFRFSGLRTNRPDEIVWMRRMRMHGGDNLSYGHAFEAWATRYGAGHPDWFEMDDKGVRRLGRSMCVSNPGFHQEIVRLWWADQQKHPGRLTNLNICENDLPGGCCCAACRAWDGPEMPWPRPEPYQPAHNVSRRYARFAAAVLELARKHDPRAEVTSYAYTNMVFGPTGMKLDPAMLVGYVPDVFFPRTAANQAWVLQQGREWISAGASLFLRPNYLLHGYCMPVNWARQYAEEFQGLERMGLIGTDFDSLTGMWSTMGLSLYACGRLHVTPRAPIDTVLGEYYAAFGPAAGAVRAYWDYWERYSLDRLGVFGDGVFHYYRYPETAANRFPPEAFGPAAALLRQAERAVRPRSAEAAKVAFLKAGMEHARLCVQAAQAFAQAGADAEKQKAAMAPLKAFRKTITDPMVVNLTDGDSSCRTREANLGWPE